MSTPDVRQEGQPGAGARDALVVRAGHDMTGGSAPPSAVTRTSRAVAWTGWHLGELAGIGVPLGLAVWLWDGFYLVSGLAAVAWLAHEVQLRRRQRAIRAGIENGGDDGVA